MASSVRDAAYCLTQGHTQAGEAPIHIACFADATYLPHLATLLASLGASQKPETLTLHLVRDSSVGTGSAEQLVAYSLRLGIAMKRLELPPPGPYPSVAWAASGSPTSSQASTGSSTSTATRSSSRTSHRCGR
jgi:hypothetical protein